MMRDYKDVRGIVAGKYRNIWGKYILLMEENGKRTKIFVSQSFYERIELGSKWTIGHINGTLINIRPGYCQDEDDYC